MQTLLPRLPRASLYQRAAVSAYLGRHFPGYKLAATYDASSDVYDFRLSKKGCRLVLSVLGEFFGDKGADQIYRDLVDRQVARTLSAAQRVSLASRGLAGSSG